MKLPALKLAFNKWKGWVFYSWEVVSKLIVLKALQKANLLFCFSVSKILLLMIFISLWKNILLGRKTVGLQQLNTGMFISNKYRFIHVPERTLFFHPPNLVERPLLLGFKCTALQTCLFEVNQNTVASLVTSLWELVCYLPSLWR